MYWFFFHQLFGITWRFLRGKNSESAKRVFSLSANALGKHTNRHILSLSPSLYLSLPWPFRTWVIMVLYNFLLFLFANLFVLLWFSVLIVLIFLSSFVETSQRIFHCFPSAFLTFSMPCGYQIYQAFFPRYVFQIF